MQSKKDKPAYAMSKRRKTGITILCLLAAVLLILLDRSYINQKLQSLPKSAEQIVAYDLEKYHGKTFAVVKVVDGDTIDIDIPEGTYPHTRVRLLGIDAPEAHSELYGEMYFAYEATEFVKELVLEKNVTVYLDRPNPTRGKYGRLLAYVKLADGRFLNEALLSEGFVYADLRFKHSFFNRYAKLQASARNQQKGLWEEVTREQLPQWLQKMQPKLLKN
jgi:endonuclease YncB( thermonuclease family)